VALAAVLAAGPRVLILDEPTGGLDARARGEIMAAVAGFNVAGGTVVLITHDMPLVAEYARRAVVLLEGRVLFDGAIPDLLWARRDLVARAGLSLPPVVRLATRLARRRGLAAGVLTPDGLAEVWSGLPALATPCGPGERPPTDVDPAPGQLISSRSTDGTGPQGE